MSVMRKPRKPLYFGLCYEIVSWIDLSYLMAQWLIKTKKSHLTFSRLILLENNFLAGKFKCLNLELELMQAVNKHQKWAIFEWFSTTVIPSLEDISGSLQLSSVFFSRAFSAVTLLCSLLTALPLRSWPF